jgi:hypothetical protein
MYWLLNAAGRQSPMKQVRHAMKEKTRAGCTPGLAAALVIASPVALPSVLHLPRVLLRALLPCTLRLMWLRQSTA